MYAADADLIRELKESADYEQLKEETKDFLFQKYIDLTRPSPSQTSNIFY